MTEQSIVNQTLKNFANSIAIRVVIPYFLYINIGVI